MKLECLAIVFVDIKDYTPKTAGQSHKANERLLGRFAGLVRPMVRAFDGNVVKVMGDAYLITFKSPTDSLLCAMAVQDQLSSRNLQIPESERFELRFAINVGEVRVQKNDIFGAAVNIAARIEGLADGGEIYFSEAAYLMMNKSEVPFEEMGYHKLKGIQNEVRIYRVPKLSEVGTYKLALPEGHTEDAQHASFQRLPFGGLALKKMYAHMSDLAEETDGSFYFASALSEIHHTANAQATHIGVQASWHRIMFPLYYLRTFSTIAVKQAFSSHTYRGLLMRFKKAFNLFRDSATYRKKALLALLLAGLIIGVSFMAWQQHVMSQKVVQQAEALKNLKARQAAAQKELTKEKERKKFLFFW